jgi:DNA-binding LytR/AlgR family response regulator
MVNIAIVEDEAAAAKTLQTILDTYARENDVNFHITCYPNAVSFLTDCKKGFDIVFMDIELPDLNGMEAAFKLREFDKQIIIVFITNMAQYAASGYEVNALYYIIKPINYQNTAYKLRRALSILAANSEEEILLSQASGLVRFSSRVLMYVEIIGHKLIYHTEENQYTAYGVLSDVEKKLRARHFYRCNSCYLVNARYIASITGFTITLLNNEQLQISHPKRKQFMLDIANWLGEGNT